MKKAFILVFLSIFTMTLSAEARTVRLTGVGAGGTTHGDRDAACGRAYERAQFDAEDQCYRKDGDVLDSVEEGCSCRKKPGSRDDYNCEARVRLSCEVQCRPSEVTLQGQGQGFDFDRSLACNDALRRAEDDTRYQCSRRDGFITYSEELSCNCRRLSGGDYECRSQVRSTCELNSCR